MSKGPNLERIALWVAALRDPDAKQALKTLTRVDGSGDCCLGIACKVAVANGLDLAVGTGIVMIGNGNVPVVSYGQLEEKSFLPIEVVKWLGFEYRDPVIGTYNGAQISATHANDTLGLSLPEIARLIELHYLTPEASAAPVTV